MQVRIVILSRRIDYILNNIEFIPTDNGCVHIRFFSSKIDDKIK